jgi:hypothetical protein
MKDEAKSQLQKILGDYDTRLAEAERAEAARRAAHAAFPDRFAAFKAETIRPALQELADVLAESGHEATVREQEESSSAASGVKAAAISLRIVPKPFARKSTEPNPSAIEITFSAHRAERKITVSSTNTLLGHGGGFGKRGEYEIDALTAELVASHVIQTLAEAFAKPK